MTLHTTPVLSRFERFRDLHEGFFVIPTIWDSLSAIAAEDAGFEAIATSSAALGYANGILSSERAPFDLVTSRLRTIAEAVRIPVSVDLEDGYPEVTGDITDSIRRIIDTGVVAANIEDSPGSHAVPLVAAEDHARAIARARQAAEQAGAGFFINARTDVFLLDDGLPDSKSIAEAVRRANLYLEAGANGVYVAAKNLSDDQVAALGQGIRGPLTLLAAPEGRPFGHWRKLGVNRISLGTLVIRNAYAAIQTQLAELRDSGTVLPFPPVDIDAVLRRGRTQFAG
jgi:2-methylisocitrate lyase-like PEP mutase family enzyme